MKQSEIGLLVALVVVGLLGWDCGGRNSPGVQNVNISIVSQTLYGGRADKVIQFRQGDKIIIHITADEPMEIFLHGYEVVTRVIPGVTSTLQFTADVAGRFALMIHSLGEGESSRVEILLGLVDVLPRK